MGLEPRPIEREVEHYAKRKSKRAHRMFFNWLSVSEAAGQFAPILMSVPIVAWAIFVVQRYGSENVTPL